MIYRRATTDDRESILKLLDAMVDSMHENGGVIVPGERTASHYAQIVDRVLEDEAFGVAVVGDDDGMVIGVVLTADMGQPAWECSYGRIVFGIAQVVEPEWRGHKVCSKLWELTKGEWSSRGYGAILGSWQIANAPSSAAWKSAGGSEEESLGYLDLRS